MPKKIWMQKKRRLRRLKKQTQQDWQRKNAEELKKLRQRKKPKSNDLPLVQQEARFQLEGTGDSRLFK